MTKREGVRAGSAWVHIATLLRYGWEPYRLSHLAINRHKAVQRLPELAALVSLVGRLKPRVVVEVGTRHGGTLACWIAVASPDALLVSIDMPAGSFGGGSGDEVVEKLSRVLQPGQSLKSYRGNSHDPEARAWLTSTLQGRSIDFLFLDGDHSLQGAQQDLDDFGPLVRKEGLIAFHDIIPEPANPHIEVPALWAKLRSEHECLEFVSPPGRTAGGMGIGVIRR